MGIRITSLLLQGTIFLSLLNFSWADPFTPPSGWKLADNLIGYPIHSQGDQGTCYANALAVIIDSIINKPPNSAGLWVSSPIALAAAYAKTRIIVGDDVFPGDDVTSVAPADLLGPFSLGSSVRACPIASTFRINGGDVCDTFNKLVENNFVLASRKNLEALFQRKTLFALPGRAWGGKLAELVDGCRVELSHQLSNRSVKDYLISPLPNDSFPSFMSSRYTSKCREFMREMTSGKMKWQDDVVLGVQVGKGTSFFTESCFPPLVLTTKTDTCTGDSKRQLLAFYSMLSHPLHGVDAIDSFAKTFATTFNGSNDLQGYSCHNHIVPIASNLVKREIFIDKIKKSIDEGIPAGISINTIEWNLEKESLKSHGQHALAIIGYRNANGISRYRIRNSWGNQRGKINLPEILFDSVTGDFDIAEELLLTGMYELQIIKK